MSNVVESQSKYQMGIVQNIQIENVPDAWIFKYYYRKHTGRNIIQPFDGRTIKIRSFKSSDTNPSLCLYCKNRRYYWKDFSVGIGGTPVKFVEEITSKDTSQAMLCIIADYERFVSEGHSYYPEDYEISENVGVRFEPMVCNYDDIGLNFWKEIKVPSSEVMRFNILQLKGCNVVTPFGQYEQRRSLMFGFFKQDGSCYQIYNPGKDPKYISIDSTYLKGSEQLIGKYDTCVIVSGLKDIAAISQLNLECEFVAPPVSESVLIKPEIIKDLKSKYKYLITMFDNDQTGIRMMLLYKKTYDIDFVRINLKKDHALNNKMYELIWLRANYGFYINKVINK